MTFEESKYEAGRLLNEFVELMRNRLIVGTLRYGKNTSVEYDFVANAKERIDRYLQDGNREHLVDAANFLVLEFKNGVHPLGHFKSQGVSKRVGAKKRE